MRFAPEGLNCSLKENQRFPSSLHERSCRLKTLSVRFVDKTLTPKYDQRYYFSMSIAKVTVSIEGDLLKKVDYLVKSKVFPNRSQAIQIAVQEKVAKIDKNRLERECALLDKSEEHSLADFGLASEVAEFKDY